MNTLPSVFVSHPHRFRLSKKHFLDMAVSTTHFSHLKGLSQVSITSSPPAPSPQPSQSGPKLSSGHQPA